MYSHTVCCLVVPYSVLSCGPIQCVVLWSHTVCCLVVPYSVLSVVYRFTLHFYQRPNAYEGLLIMVKKQLVVEQVVRQELAGSWNGRIALHVLTSFGDNRPKVRT